MSVVVKAWSNRDALAIVDGTRVCIRRQRRSIRWICDEHGNDNHPHCPHLAALAATPADPDKRRERPHG